jgi:hypothetical protein
MRVLSVDNSDGVAKESIGDTPAGFPNMLGSPERVIGARGAERSLAADVRATRKRVEARKTVGERRGIVGESKLQTWSPCLLRENHNLGYYFHLCSKRVLGCPLYSVFSAWRLSAWKDRSSKLESFYLHLQVASENHDCLVHYH